MYHQILQLLTLCLFAGSTCAVFYIPGSVVSYPKMGKRAFYTNATGNRYPLMGRRSSGTSSDGQADSPSQNAEVAMAGAMVQNDDEYNKRGVFTQGPHRSFPRVGRSGSSGESSDASSSVSGKIRSEILKSLAERLNRNVLDVLGGSQGQGQMGAGLVSGGQQQGGQSGDSAESLNGLEVPQFLFLIFDEDGDSKLTKEEFTSGMAKVLEQNLLC